jgi:hypothetical protein
MHIENYKDTNYHVWFAMPAVLVHQGRQTSFEHWSFGYIVLGPARVSPVKYAVMLNILGYMEHLFLFPVISGLYH